MWRCLDSTLAYILKCEPNSTFPLSSVMQASMSEKPGGKTLERIAGRGIIDLILRSVILQLYRYHEMQLRILLKFSLLEI